MSTMTGLQSSASLSTVTRAGLIGGVMVGNLNTSQRELSHSAEVSARRAQILRAARREHCARRHARSARNSGAKQTTGVSRWTTWLPSGLGHRSSDVPQNSNASASC